MNLIFKIDENFNFKPGKIFKYLWNKNGNKNGNKKLDYLHGIL